MPTLTLAEMRARAAQFAGVPRAELSLTEAQLLNTFLTTHLRAVWTAAPWPALRRVQMFTPSDRRINKQVDAQTHMGVVRRITNADPRTTTRYHSLNWHDEGQELVLAEEAEEVWVEYLIACPDLLTSYPAEEWDEFEVPLELAQPTCLLAAGSLLRARGQRDLGNEFIALGQEALRREAVLAGKQLDQETNAT